MKPIRVVQTLIPDEEVDLGQTEEHLPMRRLLAWAGLILLLAGCNSDPQAPIKPPPIGGEPRFPRNDTPQGAVRRLIATYDAKAAPEYQGMFTGDFTYEFSTSTDPTLVQQYSTGWFKNDEKQSSVHLFNGFTPLGGSPKPPATTIDIGFAVTLPADDNTSGTDPATHKVLASRVDGGVTIPTDTDTLTIEIQNNYDVLYIVRGDVAVGLDSSQPADGYHWYISRWVDLSEAASPSPTRSPMAAKSATWGFVKGLYR
jgi:hypothetical protein